MQEAAYFNWLSRGCPSDDSWADWFIAREEVFGPPIKDIETHNLPIKASGWSTGFAPGCIANIGDNKFLFDTHVYSNGCLWMGDSVGSIIEDNINLSLYGGLANGRVTGLFYDSPNLYFSFGPEYNTGNKSCSFIGVTTLDGGAKLLGDIPQGNLWSRGGITKAPDGTILTGFGGVYTIFAGGSFGPCLVDDRGVAWLGYPQENKCYRPDDYYPSDELVAQGSASSWLAEAPSNGFGKWAGTDEIGGEDHSSCVLWIGDYVYIWCYQGTGRIGYDSSAVTAHSHINRVYRYSISDLYAVRDGKMSPWEPVPEVTDFPIPAGLLPTARVAGGCKVDDSTFYIVWVNAVSAGVEYYPAVVKYITCF